MAKEAPSSSDTEGGQASDAGASMQGPAAGGSSASGGAEGGASGAGAAFGAASVAGSAAGGATAGGSDGVAGAPKGDAGARGAFATENTLYYLGDRTAGIQPAAIAVDDTYLYWGQGHGDLWVATKDGLGTPRRLVSMAPAVWTLGVTPTHVFWLNQTTLMRMPKAGGTAEAVELDWAVDSYIATDSRFVYAGLPGCAAVVRVDHTTLQSSALTVAVPVDLGRGLTYLHVDGSTVYCAGSHGVYRIHDWGGLESVVDSATVVFGVAMVSGQVLWSDEVDSTLTFWALSPSGTPQQLADYNVTPTSELIGDEARARVIFVSSGSLMAFSPEAKQFTRLAAVGGGGIARDEQYVYWGRSTPNIGSIERMRLDD